MILLALTAFAETPDLEARLLGGEAPMATVPASTRPASPSGWMGVALAAGALALGALAWRRELKPGSSSEAVRIVGRRSVSSGAVVLVDIDGLDGTTHRLVLGTGSSGPRVLADVTVGLASLAEVEEELS